MTSITTTEHLNESQSRCKAFMHGVGEGQKVEVRSSGGFFTFKMKGGKLLRIKNN